MFGQILVSGFWPFSYSVVTLWSLFIRLGFSGWAAQLGFQCNHLSSWDLNWMVFNAAGFLCIWTGMGFLARHAGQLAKICNEMVATKPDTAHYSKVCIAETTIVRHYTQCTECSPLRYLCSKARCVLDRVAYRWWGARGGRWPGSRASSADAGVLSVTWTQLLC